jgi:iron complex outermembrane receptor protein
MTRTLLATTSMIAVALMTGNARAQTSDPNPVGATLEEIVVTAQKREQSIQDVPISITAISGDAISDNGYQNISELAAQTPGVQVQENDLFPAYFIRGAGLLVEATDLNEQPVGSYLDDVYLGSPSASRGQLFDVDRVEILKGPQGTLFGRNTSAGVINYLSRRPGDKANGYIQLGYGRFGRFEAEGAVGGPLTTGIRMRASAKYLRSDGWQRDRLTNIKFGNSNIFSGRVQLEADITSALSFRGKVDYSNSDENGVRYSFSGLLTPTGGRCTPEVVDTNACQDANGTIDREFDWQRPATNVAPQDILRSVGYTGRFDLDLGGAKLTSITAFRNLKREWRVDGDASPKSFFGGTLDFESFRTADNDQFSQELRLAGSSGIFNYVVGGFYYNDRRMFQSIFPGAGQNTLSNTQTKSYAAFGQVDVAFSSGTTLTGGLRYTSEDRSITQRNFVRGISDTLVNNDSKLTGKLSIQQKLSSDAMVYVSASTGFKSGTYAQSLRAKIVAVAPETVRAFEAGIKTEFLDGRGRFNLAAYHNRYKDFQATGSVIDPVTGFTSNKLNNVGVLKVTGLEGALTLLPVTGMTLDLGFALAHSKTSSTQTSGEPDPLTGKQYGYDGKRAPHTPTVQLTGSLRYDVPIGDAGTISPMITANWQSMSFHGADNNPFLVQDSFAMVNARLIWQSAGKSMTGQIYVDNIFNKRVEGSQYLISFIGLRSTVWGSRPRSFGIRLGAAF